MALLKTYSSPIACFQRSSQVAINLSLCVSISIKVGDKNAHSLYFLFQQYFLLTLQYTWKVAVLKNTHLPYLLISAVFPTRFHSSLKWSSQLLEIYHYQSNVAVLTTRSWPILLISVVLSTHFTMSVKGGDSHNEHLPYFPISAVLSTRYRPTCGLPNSLLTISQRWRFSQCALILFTDLCGPLNSLLIS